VVERGLVQTPPSWLIELKLGEMMERIGFDGPEIAVALRR
jgi:hypothetical protein